MQVYPDQTNVTIDMINKYVKGSFSKECTQKGAHNFECIFYFFDIREFFNIDGTTLDCIIWSLADIH